MHAASASLVHAARVKMTGTLTLRPLKTRLHTVSTLAMGRRAIGVAAKEALHPLYRTCKRPLSTIPDAQNVLSLKQARLRRLLA